MAEEIIEPTSYMRRNFMWLFVSQVLTWGITLLVLVLTPNRLSEGQLSTLAFAGAFVGFFTFAGTLGTGAYLTKTISRDPECIGAYVYNALVMKLVLSVLLAGIALALALLFGFSSTELTLVGLGLGGLLLSLLNDVAIGGLAGLHRMARPAAWLVVQTYLTSGLALVALWTHQSIVVIASSGLIGLVIPVLANVKHVWRFVHNGRTTIDFGVWKTIARGGLPLLLLSGLILVYGTVDIPLLRWLGEDGAVGVYSFAYRWVGIPLFVSTIVVSATAPALAAMAHDGTGRFAALANRSLQLVLALSLPAATGLVIIAFDLMDLVNGYPGSALLVRILAVHIPLVAVSSVLGAVLFAADRQNRYTRVALVAAIVNPPMTGLLIKFTLHTAHNGAIGAALGTVATEVFMVLGAYRIRPAGVFDRTTASFAVRCLAANAMMAVPLVVFDDLELFVKIAIGAALYVVGSLLLRTFTVAELRQGLDVVRNRVGRGRGPAGVRPTPGDAGRRSR